MSTKGGHPHRIANDYSASEKSTRNLETTRKQVTIKENAAIFCNYQDLDIYSRVVEKGFGVLN